MSHTAHRRTSAIYLSGNSALLSTRLFVPVNPASLECSRSTRRLLSATRGVAQRTQVEPIIEQLRAVPAETVTRPRLCPC